MAAEMKENLGVTVKLVEGSKGIFEVREGGEVIYSKKTSGTFPAPGEVTEIFRRR